MRLQAGAGNQAVGRMLARRVIKVHHRGAVDNNDLANPGSLAGIQQPELSILAGHGNVSTMQGYNGGEIAGLLKGGWQLPQQYNGVTRIDSCLAGDRGGWTTFFAASLVEDVSNALRGYAATVQGMKGSTATSGQDDPHPGMPRSVGTPSRIDEYNRLLQDWVNLKRLRDQEFNSGANSSRPRPTKALSPPRSPGSPARSEWSRPWPSRSSSWRSGNVTTRRSRTCILSRSTGPADRVTLAEAWTTFLLQEASKLDQKPAVVTV
jgi:hypothetical protein